MRWIIVGVGILVALTGSVFLLQGVGVIPGSYMTGQSTWAVIGLIMIVVGGALCYFVLQRKPADPQNK
jgi:uncharacterized integral membrane protein